MALLICWELLIQLSKLDFCWLQLQLFNFLSTTFSSIFFSFSLSDDISKFKRRMAGSLLKLAAVWIIKPPHTRKSIESHSLRLNIVAFTPHSLCFSLLSVGKAVSLLSGKKGSFLRASFSAFLSLSFWKRIPSYPRSWLVGSCQRSPSISSFAGTSERLWINKPSDVYEKALTHSAYSAMTTDCHLCKHNNKDV